MKNISVSLKMIICFSLMILMTLSISVAGMIGMTELNAQTTAMYEEIVVAMDYIALIRENFQEQRVLIQELLLVSTDPSKVSLDITEKSEASRVIGMINTNKTEMSEYLDAYDHTILQRKNLVNKELASAENAATFLRYSQLYRDYFEPELTRISRAYTTIGAEEIEAFIRSDESVEMAELINQGYAFYSELSRENIQESSELYTLLRAIIVIDTILTLAVSAFFAIYLPITIARPLRHMVRVADAVSEGNMDMEVGHQNRRDEVGRLAQAFGRMQTEIKGQIGVVEALAHADLTVEPTPRSTHDTLGNALVRLTDSLDQIITDVTIASDSVAVESRDVAGQSQELAQGTTEQAASVEELSSAFLEISMNTKDSATLAGKAASLTDNVRKMAMEGESLMAQLAQAVQETDTAGKNIDKIIRAIEEISFQTNILALNAAVEAAHAGQNGSGFAVVAAEVRSLASKSAASSKETSELIADTLDKIQFGAELAAKTSASFKQIVEGIMESTRLVTNIAKSSEEQAIAIDQINTGISQVAQVIHINSSAAERCASAAERMSMQARRLESSIGKFKTKAAPAGVPPTREAPEIVLEPAPPRPAAPDHIDLSPSIPTDDFGKY